MDSTSRCRFGPFDLDLTTGELSRNGRPIPLQRQPARALTCLVARAGTLVPREELHSAIWDRDVHVDFDRGLNYCIRQLREALDDDAKTPRFIETISRQGYRFIAAVEVVPPKPELRPVRLGRLPRAASVAAVSLLALFAAHAASGGDQRHHEVTVAIVRAIHDAVF